MEKDRINDTEKSFLSGKKRMDKLKVLMKYAGISVFEYFPDSDRMVLYNEQLEEEKGIMPFLGQLGQICTIHPEDVQKMREFLLGQTLGTVELKLLKKGHYKRVLLDALQKEEGDQSVIGCIRDITEIRKREELLEDQARRDSMTGLYNHDTGKLLVNEYLREKRMDASSGLLMLDVDHFKNVNDVYGHVPLNDVKLGRGFMEKCEKDYRGIGFLRQMIGMLKSLGFQVLCEGVESARQVEVLKTSGCDHVQGNWFSMPLSAKEFEKMLSLPGEIFCRCRKNEEHRTGGEA